jgi:hypothetical protein
MLRILPVTHAMKFPETLLKQLIELDRLASNRRSDESRTIASALRLSCYIDDVTRLNIAHEKTTTAKNMGILKYHQTALISYEIKRLAPGMPGRSYQTN